MDSVDIPSAAADFWSNIASYANPTCSAVSASLQSSRPCLPCLPCSDSCINPSLHRPHVLASDRLLLWTTPAGQDWQRDLESRFPDSIIFKLFQVMIRSLDHDTCSNYGSGLLCFTQFCDRLNIPEAERMPASQPLIASFAASHAGTISDKTLNNWLAGLHFWHLVNGSPWSGADMLRSVRRGLAKMVPPSSHRAKRPPVTIEALTLLVNSLDSFSPLDVAVSAVACVAFWLCCHLGELLPPSAHIFDPSKHVSRSVLPITIKTLLDSSSFTSIHIPWSKTMQEHGADISITTRAHCTDPLHALVQHQINSYGLPSHVPLFSFHSITGWTSLSKPSFIARCNDIWTQHGFPRMPGHAFWIGGTTELLLQGVNPDIIAVQGRWSSRAFLEYWQHIEMVLPLFISSSIDTACLQDVDTVIKDYIRRHDIR